MRRHIESVIERLAGKAHALLLESGARGSTLSIPMLPGHPVLALPSERLDDLVKVLRHSGVGRVHVHHLLGMSLDVRALIKRLDVPFDVTMHDYLAICPQVNLLASPVQLYCGEPAIAACNACISMRPSHGARDILSWRAERAWQFQEAEQILCPSHDALVRLQRYGLAAAAVVVPHDPVDPGPWPVRVAPPGQDRLRIAVLGVLADHKGARMAAAVAEACDPATTEIHLIGYTENNFPKPALKRMTVTGRYEDAELPGLIDKVAPHIVWFPAAWPETFSYTLSVAIESGLPIAATEIGCFPERLRGRPFTWLADHRTSPAEWLALFDQIRSALPDEPAGAPAVLRDEVKDFYRSDYLRPPATGRRARRTEHRPVIAVVPERYDNGLPTPCAFIRLLQPLDHPAISGGFEVRLADAKSVLDIKADVIVTQRYALADIRSVEVLASQPATPAPAADTFDDDLLNIARTHPEAETLRPKAPTVRRLLGMADAVWVSTAPLAESLRRAARTITVVPNGLDQRIWAAAPPNEPPPSGPARLFCMGTTTHDRDFAMIIPALVRLKEEFAGDVEIDLIGMTAASDLPPGINRLGVPHQASLSYPGFVNWLTSVRPGWHIGLAPLLDTPFNRSKSAIKAMDYTALGLAVVASDVDVYRESAAGGPAGQLVANNPRAWHAALGWLIRNRALRLSLAAAARPAFLASSTLAVQAEARRVAWLRLLAGRRVETAA